MFSNLFPSSNEHEYFKLVAKRPAITDDEFYITHYQNTDITLDTCTRVRRVLCEQLRMCNTIPNDNVAVVYDDIDIVEVCFEIAEEFGITFNNSNFQEIDGTVDSLIRLTQLLI
ncbi:MAG: hypothetical protein AAF623_14745 [Planctomycetota bacterium]